MTPSSPKIAVLFPVFNPGVELVATLASIRDQSVPSRLFLIDDGSERKPDYAPMMKGMNVELVELPKNLGITGAMNAGLAEILKADFEYVARLDNGDINDLTRFEKQVSYLQSHSDLAFVGTQVKAEFELTGLKVELNYPETHEACSKQLRYGSTMWHGAIMFRMSFLRAMRAYSTEYPAAEDYAMQLWAVKNGYRIGNLPERLYRTIEMNESISGGSRQKQLKSRLKLQRENADWLDPHCYFGMARTAALLVTPVNPLRKIKRRLTG